jgi:hypothetical protein
MEYYPDLSVFPDPWVNENHLNLVAIGWLDPEITYPKGKVSEVFIEKLELFCSYPMIMTFGIDWCHICNPSDEPISFVKAKLRSGKEIQLFGEYDLRIPSPDGTKIYATSDFILHFVTKHEYLPPQEFVDAVMNAPLPGTPEFEKFAETWKESHVW